MLWRYHFQSTEKQGMWVFFPMPTLKHVLTLFNVGNDISCKELVTAIVGAIVKTLMRL